ncbi:double zinc ribbon domain-containing protein [bacterium]|nr:double zinc ribbon domain-containing protein [bacterium]
MRGRGSGLLDGLLSLLYPPACTACGADLKERLGWAVLCPECAATLVPLESDSCPRCASPLREGQPCAFCARLEPGMDLLRSAYWFAGPAPELVHAFKYRRRVSLASGLAELTLSHPGCIEVLERADLLAPVPLHLWRRLRRGYNQSERYAAALAALSDKRVESRLLRRVRRTRSQTRLDPQQRKLNVEGAFKVRDRTLVEGRSVCIIDDVMTTGATAGACAAALKDAGAEWVAALTFARA